MPCWEARSHLSNLQLTIQGTQETPSSNEEIIETHALMPVQNQTANETEVEQEIMKRKLL